MRRGIRFHQWWMLLMAIHSILSGQGSLVGMERFAKRLRQTLNELLGTDCGMSPSDSTFRFSATIRSLLKNPATSVNMGQLPT